MFGKQKFIKCMLCCALCVIGAIYFGFVDKQNGDLIFPNITGLWIIDSESLFVLVDKLDFDSYTNQYDHVLLLNDDGSCAYRGVDFDYVWKPFRTSPLSEMIDSYEKNIFWYIFSKDRKNALLHPSVEQSYYLFDKNCGVIAGPYTSNDIPEHTTGQTICINRWTHWRVVPHSKFTPNERLSDNNYMVKCQWHLQLMNSHRKMFFHLETRKHDICLWKPAIYHFDFAGPEKIIFRKAEPASSKY